jgi:hypothetical protein
MPLTKPGGHTGKRRLGHPSTAAVRLDKAPLRSSGNAPRGAVDIPRDRNPPPPADWHASTLEWYVYFYLTRVRHWADGNEFQYQVKVGGGRQPGGIVPDFVVYNRTPPLALSVAGARWHAGTLANLAKDEHDRIQLMNYGWDLVMLWEDDLIDRLDYTMREALDFGREISLRPMNW